MSDFIKLSDLGAPDPNDVHINISNIVEVSDDSCGNHCTIYLCNGHTVEIYNLSAVDAMKAIRKHQQETNEPG